MIKMESMKPFAHLTNVIKCDLRQKYNRKETRTIHIGILYWYSVQTDFNEQE